ncbi:DNA helicase, partial [Acinetobacter baumannii]
MRFSTTGIPRHMCARLEGQYLSLPRGCLTDIIHLLNQQDTKIKLKDQRTKGNILVNINLLTELSSEQEMACKKSLNTMLEFYMHQRLLKTVTAISIIAKRQTNTLIIVHNK